MLNFLSQGNSSNPSFTDAYYNSWEPIFELNKLKDAEFSYPKSN